MPQSLVIDVNTQVTLATNNYWPARAARNSSITENCINVVNAMLDKKHRYTFSTQDYNFIEHEVYHITCECQARIKLSDSSIRHKPQPTNQLSHLAAPRIPWIKYVACPECHAEITISEEMIEETINHDIDESTANRFLPEPPRINNLLDHVVYASKYWAWTDFVWAALMKRHQHQREIARRDDLGDDPES